MKAVLFYAFARLRARRGRSLLAAAGIAASAAMLGAAVTVSLSLHSGFDRTAKRAQLADVLVRFAPQPRAKVAGVIGELANVRSASYRLQSSGEHVDAGGRSSRHGTLIGVDPGSRGYAIVAGRDLTGADGEIVIEAGLARAWHLHLGQRVLVTDFRGGHEEYHVVGEAVSPDTVAYPLAKGPSLYANYFDVRYLIGAPAGSVNGATIRLNDPTLLDTTLAQARAASFGVSGLEFVTRTGLRLLIGQAAGIVIALLVAFSLVALVAAGTMLAASAGAEVQRRLESIGLLRALGASRRDLVAGAAAEAALVALPAGALGLAVGWAAVRGPTDRLLGSINEVGLGIGVVPPLLACLAVVTAIVAGASAWPAWRATRRSVVETLRSGDVVAGSARCSGSSIIGLGARLVLARPARGVASVVALAAAASVALLILTIASVLQHLDQSPAAIGKRYQLSVPAPAAAAPRIARVDGVAAATPRYQVDVADSFQLDEPFRLIAFGNDPGRFEAPPLAEGRRARTADEAEVGVGLAAALGVHVGSTLAAQLPNGREIRFRVAGVVRALQDQGRVAYVGAGPLLAADPFAPSSIAVVLAPGRSSSDVKAALALQGYFPSTSGGIAGQSVQGFASRSSGFISILVALLRSVVVLDAAVCLYAVAQLLALTAHERRRAVAVLRALGASRLQIAAVFALAAELIAAVALPLAVVLERYVVGPAVSRLAASYVTLPLAAGPTEIAVTVLALLAGAAVAAALVGRSATSRPIVAGLRET